MKQQIPLTLWSSFHRLNLSPLFFSDFSEFPPIADEQQRSDYKREFDRDHQEYKDLQAELDSLNKKLSDVDRELDDLQEGSPQYLVRDSYLFYMARIDQEMSDICFTPPQI